MTVYHLIGQSVQAVAALAVLLACLRRPALLPRFRGGVLRRLVRLAACACVAMLAWGSVLSVMHHLAGAEGARFDVDATAWKARGGPGLTVLCAWLVVGRLVPVFGPDSEPGSRPGVAPGFRPPGQA